MIENQKSRELGPQLGKNCLPNGGDGINFGGEDVSAAILANFYIRRPVQKVWEKLSHDRRKNAA